MNIVNLTDHLLERGRTFQQLGRTGDALRTLTRLAGFRALPARTAEETQSRLAEIHLKGRRFRRARRHLTAALGHQPDHAPHHYGMARACQADGRGDLRRALEHYRRALALDADDPACLCDAGMLAVQLGRTDDGLAWLRHALELAPADVEIVGKVARGLGQAGQTDEARTVLRLALFRQPRDPRFRKLYNDFQFHELRRRQELERLERETGVTEEEPTLLPFLRPVAAAVDGDGRYDGPATLPGPHGIERVPSPNVKEQTGSGDLNG